MDFLLPNIIDIFEEYHKKEIVPIDNNKRTCIIIQSLNNISKSLLTSNNKY